MCVTLVNNVGYSVECPDYFVCVCVCVTLVNNVGYSVEYPDYFAETPEDVSCEEQ